MADNARAKRLADLIREVVAQKLQRGIKDPRLGTHVTITDRRVTIDWQPDRDPHDEPDRGALGPPAGR